jgi:gliding motility-associated protein GldE
LAADTGIDGVLVAVEALIFALLLALSALFSGSEVALFSLNSGMRQTLSESRERAAVRVTKLLEQPRELLVSILILNNLANVGAAIIAAVSTKYIADQFGWSEIITVLAEIFVVAFVILVVSEITPKMLATRNPVTFSKRIAGPLLALHTLLRPISSLAARAMEAFHGRIQPAMRRVSGEDLKAMAEIGEEHGTLEEGERELITSIVEFGETAVREIMISRLDIAAIDVTMTLPEALRLIKESGHSRLPLFVDHLDNILGIIHAKDLLRFVKSGERRERIEWTSIARRAMFVPLGKKLDDLLREFQARKTHIAIVVDEYGGTAGIVTLEDVLEEIVGEIRDEYDHSEEPLYEQLDENTYRCDARINLDEINAVLGTQIKTEKFDFETLGGLVLHLSGAIPEEGSVFTYHGMSLEVLTVENRRIGEVKVRIVDYEDAAEGADG